MQSAEPDVVELTAQPAATVAGRAPMNELPSFFDQAFSTLPDVLATQAIAPTGPAFAWYERQPTDVADLRVGFPVTQPITASGTVEPFELPAGRAARLVHVGGYDGLAVSWNQLVDWTLAAGHQPAGPFWESYVTEPTPDGDPAQLRTELFLLLA